MNGGRAKATSSRRLARVCPSPLLSSSNSLSWLCLVRTLSILSIFSPTAIEGMASVTCQGRTDRSAGILLALPMQVYLGTPGHSQGHQRTRTLYSRHAHPTTCVNTAVVLSHRQQYNLGRRTDGRSDDPMVARCLTPRESEKAVREATV